MGTTQRMAQFIANAKYEDIPAPAVNLAKLCLLDAVGCALYGTTRPLGKIMTSLVDELGGKPTSRVLGTRIETNAVNAAMAAIVRAHREAGTRSLDLWGVREPDDPSSDATWEGFSLFKRRFGGLAVRHPGTFDLVVDPFWNRVRDLRERARDLLR